MQPNILFVMADQLRWDYLGCTGHPHIRTPAIDALAARGVNFTRAFVQAPVCGGSRMSFYTGRYNVTHGATYNNFPLRLDEQTIGDYLRPLGYRVALTGKTHMAADREAMARLGIDPGSSTGVLASQCGFEPYERDDGLHPDQSADPNLAYNTWLRQLGYRSDNPWHDFANAAEGDNGEVLSGWSMRHARRPARVKEEHSETAYMTDRALAFIDEAGAGPWCLHLSYIKPHWPYVAPAPYHAMYGPDQVIPANRSEGERADPHPVVAAFMAHEESRNFSRDEVRATVIPTYMGLISQFDRHVGRVIEHLEKRGLAGNTIIVVTSDHGDYLGDHWLGEKDLFHEEIVRIPLIILDPRAAAGGTRGARPDGARRVDRSCADLPRMGRRRARATSARRALAAAPDRGRDAARLARRRLLRRRLCAAPRAPAARSATRPGARLHGADRALEVRPVRGFSAAAVRSRIRSARVERPRPRAGFRHRPRRNGAAAVRLVPGLEDPRNHLA